MQKASSHIKKNDLATIPKQSFIYSQKFRIGVPSVIVGMGVILASLYFVGFSENTSIRDVGVIFGVLAMIVPLTMLQVKESQRKDSIDRNLPLFLLALSSAVQSGANLIRAIETTAERNMGALTPELKNLRANLSWGMPVEDCFENWRRYQNKFGNDSKACN